MRLGVRTILLGVAILMFLLALVLDDNTLDLMLLGLIFIAGALIAEDLGVGRGPGDTGARR